MINTSDYLVLALLTSFLFAGCGGGGDVATPATALPDTGQTTSYTTTLGEDSDYLSKLPSYMDNGDGTVVDNVTGLMWQQQDDNTKYNWYEATGTTEVTLNPAGATDVCGALTTGGYMDWRLPTDTELQLIGDYGMNNPAIDTIFFGVSWGGYWTSTTYFGQPLIARVADNHGYVYFNARDETNYVRCVRGEQLSFRDFADNGDGTVTDRDISLVWQQQDDATLRDWESALNYCEGLDLANAQDWRLPNIKELNTIVDTQNHDPVINSIFFTATSLPGYWSSTTSTGDGAIAWSIFFSDGYVTPNSKSSDHYVRCVHGGVIAPTTSTNTAPTADAGVDQSVVFPNRTATLDGSGSIDVDGDTLTYVWSIVSSPVGSLGIFTNPTAVNATLTSSGPGTYTIRLVVTDGIAASAADTVVINF